MQHAHHPAFVLLSLLVAVLGSWTALDLFRRVRTHVGRARTTWLAIAALAMGASIWSMHFIAMLGFDPGSPVRYDPPLTALSLALAILATGGAFFAAAQAGATWRRVALAGGFMGAGICLMHYVGMAALRTAISLGYDPALVMLSLLIAVGASTAALVAAGRERSMPWRAAAAGLLGAAIVGMHYTAMAALRLVPGEVHTLEPSGVPPLILAFAVAAGALMILFLALAASLYDRRLDVLGALDAGRVGYWELALPQRSLQVSAQARDILGRGPGEPFGYRDWVEAVHPDDRERRQAGLAAALSSHVDYDAEYRVLRPDGQVRWVNVRGRTITDGRGRSVRMIGVVLDVTDRHAAFAALAESEGRFRVIADSAPALIWMTDAEGRLVFINRHYETLFGRKAEELGGSRWAKVVVPEDLEPFRRGFAEAFAERRSFKIFIRARGRDGRLLWLRCEGAPRFGPDGAFFGYTGCNVDVTEAMTAQEQQRLLINELNHRVKNTLATVQSIAAQTARRADSPEDFRDKFEARIIALSKTHNLLTQGGWERAGLRELLALEFAPYPAEQVRLEGPDLDLAPRQVVALGLVFHELTTNAVKYGALSRAGGCVRVSWRLVLLSPAERRLVLDWREEGGPAVQTPTRRGFGSRLIETSLKGELGGTSRMAFQADGLECRLEVSLAELTSLAQEASWASG
jgi:PAS domain S-box-containing protein